MEQVEMQLSDFTLRSRSMAVSHRATGLDRGLDPGETLVVRDPGTGHSYEAVVADVDFELLDTVYRLELGTLLAPEESADWLGADAADPDEVTTQELMALLVELGQTRRMLNALVEDVAR